MESLRITFARELEKQMQFNRDIILLTGDLGFGIFDEIRRRFPEQFFNCQASEQAMMGIAVGMALKRKIPFVYSITPFLLCRPFETIRNYINHEKIPVKLVGSGRDWDYEHDGFSHYAGDDKKIMTSVFTKIEILYPEYSSQIEPFLKRMINSESPFYLNLTR